MRWTYDSDPSIYRCCFCCHVRTGTIVLGIFQMFLCMLLLSVLAVTVLHPELVRDENGEYLPAIQVTSFHNYNSTEPVLPNNVISENQFLWILFTLGIFVVTVMLVYGAVKGHPGYLMPFFCLQVFDFCLSCLSVVGYLSHMPNIRGWIEAERSLPFRDELLAKSNDWLMLWAVLFMVLTLTIKAYLIGVVWSCYKYLGIHQPGTAARNRTYGGETPPAEDTEMLLPPKYEDVIQLPPPGSNEPPPPPYAQ